MFIETARQSTSRTLPRWVVPLLSVAVFCGVLYLLHHALQGYQWRNVVAHVRSFPLRQLGLALLFTIASYWVLTFYDYLALRYVQQRVSLIRTTLTSFIAFALGHNIGLVTLTGAAIRVRMYGAVGVSAGKVALMSAFVAFTTALGGVWLVAYALWARSGEAASVLHVSSPATRTVAVALALAWVAYFGLTAWLRRPLTLSGWSFRLPSPQITLGQTLVSAVDLCLAAAALYVLLPQSSVSYGEFVGVYVLSVIAIILSNVPGGLGVLESVMIYSLPQIPVEQLLAALLAFRAIYFLLPLGAASLPLAFHEAWLQRHRLAAAADVARDWLSAVAPQALGGLVFVAGLVLLLSGATSPLVRRLDLLASIVPLPVLELSHLLSSVAGLGLVILSRALFRRVQLAWHLAMILLFAGAAFSLLKGIDYEEALVALLIAGLLYLARGAFYRRAALLASPFSPNWIGGLAILLIVVVWIGMFAHRHVEYSNELWWTFAFQQDTPRMLRAMLTVSVLAAAFVVHSWLSPGPPEPKAHDVQALEEIKPIISRATHANANLALLGDKRLLIHPQHDGFLMYQIAGRSWVAMGDPVGSEERALDLAWSFRELSDQHGGWSVFYQVTPEALPIYLDLGLALLKLGEEARVPLEEFSLEGSKRGELRTARRKAEREGASFEVVGPTNDPQLMEQLRMVSEEWLATKSASEKRFSVGYFDPDYLAHFPIGIVKRDGNVVAFASIWLSGTHNEVAVDLMRHSSAAPNVVMDYLFVELMLWAKEHGYRWFNLGMAPLSGLEQHPLAPAWHRMGNFVFDVGEQFYNFEGLRRYKEKFHPLWEPRYLAAPRGFALPRVLVDVTALIAGGLKEIVTK